MSFRPAHSAAFWIAAAMVCPIAIVAGTELANHAAPHPRLSLTYSEVPPAACRDLAASLGKAFGVVSVNTVQLTAGHLSPPAIAAACARASNRLAVSKAVAVRKG